MPAAYPDSYYAATADLLEPFPELEGEVTCDICVVGAGFTGLSAALSLALTGFDVVVLDATRIAWAASGRNGGQIGSGQRLDQVKLAEMVGEDNAKQLWSIGEEAKAAVFGLIDKYGIDCELKRGILHPAHKPEFADEWQRYAQYLQAELGYAQAEPLDDSALKDRLGARGYFGGYADHGAGHLHPLKYALGLTRALKRTGVRIFEESRVMRFRDQNAVELDTIRGMVRARFVLLAANTGLIELDKHPREHIMPIENYLLATEPLDEDTQKGLIRDNYAVSDSRFIVYYYRLSDDGRLIFGGGERYTPGAPRDTKRFVRRHMLKVFPQLRATRVDYAWGGTVAITRNRLPYFRRVSNNVLAAGGYCGHGIALGTLGGQILAEAVQGVLERFDLLAGLPKIAFPGGQRLRHPLHVAGMTWFAMRDRLGSPLTRLRKQEDGTARERPPGNGDEQPSVSG